MIRLPCLLVLAVAALACGSDPQPSIATSATDRPDPQPTATAPVVASSGPSPATSGEPGAPAHAAGDPATLLGGGQVLEKLPTRAVAPGKSFNPRLRQQLMTPPSPDL